MSEEPNYIPILFISEPVAFLKFLSTSSLTSLSVSFILVSLDSLTFGSFSTVICYYYLFACESKAVRLEIIILLLLLLSKVVAVLIASISSVSSESCLVVILEDSVLEGDGSD